MVLCSAVAFLVGVILAGGVTPTPVVSTAAPHAANTPAAPRPTVVAVPGAVNFADVAERINAAVVNIDAASRGGRPRGRLRPDDTIGNGQENFESPRQGSGSGFIIDKQGLVLTNYHVIEDADRITVTLADGRGFRADVVGTDPAIDVALLRIPSAGGLPEAPLGDSDTLRVGEWVCAIGNPLGYVHSVTVGVVSFIGRKLFDPSLDDYIQTDAAINFGNSGGPLINARGEVIGINSAISSRASNIGFAVPINQAIAILPQLEARGRVSRGFLGVLLTDVTPDLQRALKLTVARGALVQEITPDSPAQRAGLRPYDVIIQVDDHEVWTNQELIREISGRMPGAPARLEFVRDGRHQSVTVRLVERPATDTGDMPGLPPRPPAPVSNDTLLGLSVRDLDAGFVRRLDIPSDVQGAVVTRVDPAGAAFVPAIRRGFVVMEINRQPVRSAADFQRIVAAAHRGDVLAFYGYDPTFGQRTFVTVTMDDAR
ncbi:MAG TPA: trypsin-like peptidase domain-containing protein [Vicinamibacterales bacterium]|nr:trypsin-like peptidase domain-containing protein [Vicinamibacterales bacterium]